jgi:hypothetical protein
VLHGTALLRLPISRRVWASAGRISDGVGEFGERRSDAESTRGVDAEFGMSAAEVLQERVSSDDRLRGPVAT